MKTAEEYLKSRGLKNPPLDSGISGGGDTPRKYASGVMQEYAEQFARLQIEKDRQEVKRLMNNHLKDFEGLGEELESILDTAPITLD